MRHAAARGRQQITCLTPRPPARPSPAARSYARYEILSGFVNGVFLLFIGFFVFIEAVEVSVRALAGKARSRGAHTAHHQRIFEPPDISSNVRASPRPRLRRFGRGACLTMRRGSRLAEPRDGVGAGFLR